MRANLPQTLNSLRLQHRDECVRKHACTITADVAHVYAPTNRNIYAVAGKRLDLPLAEPEVEEHADGLPLKDGRQLLNSRRLAAFDVLYNQPAALREVPADALHLGQVALVEVWVMFDGRYKMLSVNRGDAQHVVHAALEDGLEPSWLVSDRVEAAGALGVDAERFIEKLAHKGLVGQLEHRFEG